jgi:hypothetical protein
VRTPIAHGIVDKIKVGTIFKSGITSTSTKGLMIFEAKKRHEGLYFVQNAFFF